jgi:long-chain acyl-CoA synthetase
LHVTGRAKNLIVLGSGKNVQPEELEMKLFDSPLIEEGCVLGRIAKKGLLAGSEEIWAVVVPSAEAKTAYTNREATLLDVVRKEVEVTAEQFAQYKRPSRVVVNLDGLPKTSTRKVKRIEVHQWLDRQETL